MVLLVFHQVYDPFVRGCLTKGYILFVSLRLLGVGKRFLSGLAEAFFDQKPTDYFSTCRSLVTLETLVQCGMQNDEYDLGCGAGNLACSRLSGGSLLVLGDVRMASAG
jgi:hypothetical protein